MIHRQSQIIAAMTQDDRSAVTACYVNATGGTNRRGKDETVDTGESKRFAERLSSRRFEPGQNVLIVPEEIKDIVVEQRRGEVGRQLIEFPSDTIRICNVTSRSGKTDGQRGLAVVTITSNAQAPAIHR